MLYRESLGTRARAARFDADKTALLTLTAISGDKECNAEKYAERAQSAKTSPRFEKYLADMPTSTS
jgi:hypothetical protein